MCPMARCPLSAASASSWNTWVTRPMSRCMRTHLPSDAAIPALSCPRCCSENSPKNASSRHFLAALRKPQILRTLQPFPACRCRSFDSRFRHLFAVSRFASTNPFRSTATLTTSTSLMVILIATAACFAENRALDAALVHDLSQRAKVLGRRPTRRSVTASPRTERQPEQQSASKLHIRADLT